MKAITVEPKKPGSARYEDFPEPEEHEGSILVEAVAVGVCGTDVEIVEGKYGWAPPGKSRLVLGHESLGRVIDPGPHSSFKKGDLVVGIVRRPDPVPCPNCAVGEWDMCTNGQYTERGIKERIGDITLEMSAADYNPLPDIIINDESVSNRNPVRIVEPLRLTAEASEPSKKPTWKWLPFRRLSPMKIVMNGLFTVPTTMAGWEAIVPLMALLLRSTA